MAVVSVDLRALLLRDRWAGYSIRQIARQYGLSHNGCTASSSSFKSVALWSRKHARTVRSRRGTVADMQLRDAVEATPDATLAELLSATVPCENSASREK